jgi:hypothetical protein
MCNVKAKVIPIIIDENGSLSQSFKKHPGDIPGEHPNLELQNLPFWDQGTSLISNVRNDRRLKCNLEGLRFFIQPQK